MLGRIKHTLKERCPECGKVLQVRVLEEQGVREGISMSFEKEYICCSNPNCDYERDVEQKRKRKQGEIEL